MVSNERSCQKESLSYHTYCDTGPRFIQSHPKDRHPCSTVGFEPMMQGWSDLCTRCSNHCATWAKRRSNSRERAKVGLACYPIPFTLWIKYSLKQKTPRLKIRVPRSWYQKKGLARRNTNVKYKIPSTNQLKGQRVKVMVSMKGLAKMNTHVEYESHNTYQSNVMTKVKVLEKVKPQDQR
jgi:hypothetical protein